MIAIIKRFLDILIVRYALAGGTAAFIDITLLYLCTEFAGIYYLVSAVIATSVSFVARFALQKFFAFQNYAISKVHVQFSYYGLLYTWSVLTTVGLLYILVEWFGLWYIAAQVIAILLIASVSFFVYRHIIFSQPSRHVKLSEEAR